MRNRTVLLDVDGVILVHADPLAHTPSALDRAYRPAWMNLPGVRSLPFRDGTASGYRPQVIKMLRSAARRPHTRIVWCTSWLTIPDDLRELARRIGATFVEYPTPGELRAVDPTTKGLPIRGDGIFRHWKFALARAVRTGDPDGEVLIVDDQLDPECRPELEALGPGIGWIEVNGRRGLTPAEAGDILRWTRGGRLPRRDW